MPRVIYSLRYTVRRPSGDETIEVHFRRDGMPRDYVGRGVERPEDRAGMFGAPRPPKRRTIDLRVGDWIYEFPGYHEIVRIAVGRDEWVDEVRGDAGFVVE